jgi:hypothetical protein
MGLTERINAAWSHLLDAVHRTAPELTPEERVADWAEGTRRIQELFASRAGERDVAERLDIPADYAEFMERVGGGWEWQEQSLFTAAEVARGTAHDYRLWVTERDEDDGPQDDGLWLRIGRCADRHDTLLCCDRSHRLHGRVVDGHDDHPWLNGLTSPLCTVIAESFVAWLEGRIR